MTTPQFLNHVLIHKKKQKKKTFVLCKLMTDRGGIDLQAYEALSLKWKFLKCLSPLSVLYF